MIYKAEYRIDNNLKEQMIDDKDYIEHNIKKELVKSLFKDNIIKVKEENITHINEWSYTAELYAFSKESYEHKIKDIIEILKNTDITSVDINHIINILYK